MTGFIALALLSLGSLLFWFGYEVGSGKHRAQPNDKFFQLMGRNIDYVLGTAGVPASIGIFILAYAVWANLPVLNYFAAAFVLAGVARAYLPPEKFGPGWLRRQKKSPRKRRKAKK